MATGGSGTRASDDHRKSTDGYEDNDAWCDKCHRGKRPSKAQPSQEYSESSTIRSPATLSNGDDPDSEMRLDRRRTIRFQFPSRTSLSSSSSYNSHSQSRSRSRSRSRSSSASSSSSQDNQSSDSGSSATSLSESPSTSDSDSEPRSASPIRSRPQLSRQDFDAKSWFEKDMMQMKPDLMHFLNARPPILYSPWNAKECRDQFRTLNRNDPSDDKRRRLLNVTAMATTDRAIVKGRYTIDKKIVEFNFPSRMTTILYKHWLESPRDPAIRAPSRPTTVNVVNNDCLIVCEQLMNEEYCPVLLNMANATRVGGGFRSGASAQEEDLFRRSNYSRSLDIEFDETADKTNDRLCCTSSGECKPYRTNSSMYPLKDFDAIYSSGLCVFRHDADQGFGFMDEPLYDVCAVAIAASRDPPVDKNGQLPSGIAAMMRKKVETIFAIAQHHKHDALVLSAFGCGAFHNPPEHVANIFKSVIEQYAGVFRRIDFAITGSSSNPKGNYFIFKKVLDGLILHAPKEAGSDRNKHEMHQDQKSLQHTKQRTPCLYGVECRVQYSKKNSTHHNAKYSHPCRYSELCTNRDNEPHYTHEPHRVHLCRHGNVCKDLVDPVHRAKYRHAKLPDFLIPCKFQRQCHDKSWGHRVKFSHGELTREGRHHRKSLSKFEHLASKPFSSRHHGSSSHHHHSSVSSHHSKSRSPIDSITTTNEGNDHHHKHKHRREKRDHDSTHSDKASSSSRQNRHSPHANKRQHKTPCKYGLDCRQIIDDDHQSKYSH